MDTTLNTTAKKIVKVEVLHLDKEGYGPQRNHTRQQWRNECLDNLLAGAVAFKDWQDSWKDQINKDLPEVSFAAKLIYDDGSQSDVLGEGYEKQLDFVGHLFADDLDANGSEFQQPALFEGATFSGKANFSSATFSGNPNFSGATFSRHADFSGARFSGEADFSDARFSRHADFSSAAFIGYAYFSSATFSGYTDFSSATFSGAANFIIATFSGYTNFSSAMFSRDANFIRATFSEYTAFRSATFSGDAAFRSATFSWDANFTLATFHRQCHFENSFDKKNKEWMKETSFASKVDFENAVFKNVGHFERVRFVKYTPAFRGCQIDNTRLEFSDDSYFPRQESSDDAVKNISFLKRLADEHGQTDQALNFNAMELRAKRLQTDPKPAALSFKVVTWLYERVSNYGRSFTRPLIGYGILLVCTFIFALIHAAIYAPKDCKGEKWLLFSDLLRKEIPCLGAPLDPQLHLSGYRAAAEYTLYRAAGVLDFSDNGKATDAVARRLFGQPFEPWWMRLWGVFKAIASTALLFLAALGLRNKYRIK